MRTLITGSSHSLFFSRFVGNPQLAEKRQFDHLVKIQTKGETDISFFPTHLIIKEEIEEQNAAALLSIKNDAFVKSLQSQFDANLIEASIKPI